MNAENFGKYIKNLRSDRNLTLRQLEIKSGVSNSYLSQLENGKRGIPSPDILRKLSLALGVSYQELMAVAGYLPDNNTVTKGDMKQYNKFVEHAQIFFNNNEIDQKDKDKIFRDITDLFWDAKDKSKKNTK
ncbi:MAG: helix-turn-helix transcriptional regulator [Eubacteriaceae bacterium]